MLAVEPAFLDEFPPVRAASRSAAGVRMQTPDSDEFARLAFVGLELVPPGVVPVSEWRPDDTRPRPKPAEVSIYGGVARKPAR